MLTQYLSPSWRLTVHSSPSVLSRWAGKTVVRNLTFQLNRLSIEDDRSEGKSDILELEGDRALLDQLCATLQIHVQSFLQQSTLPTFSVPFPTSLQRREGVNFENAPIQDATTASDFTATNPVDDSTHLIAPEAPIVVTNVEETDSTLRIDPIGPCTYQLHIGTSGNASSDNPIQLSTLELFDLAEVIAQWDGTTVVVPNLPRSAWQQTLVPWVRTAAIVLITVGATATTMHLLQRQGILQVATTPEERIVEAEPLKSEAPAALDSELAPIEPQAQESSPESSQKSQVIADLESELVEELNGEIQNGDGVGNGFQNGENSVETEGLDRDQATDIRILDETPLPPPPTGLPPMPIDPEFSIFPSVPEASLSEEALGDSVPVDGTIAQRSAPETLTAPVSDESVSSVPSSNTPVLTRPPAATTSTPQVSETLAYFQQTWQPLANVTVPLQYRLTLGTDGSLQRIQPLGGMAGTSIDRTGIPLLGDPFVSPPADGQLQQIILILYPDGEVETYLEGQ